MALVFGKPVGVIAASWLAVRLGLAVQPPELSWRVLAAGALLTGIGFTMSLFIAALAYPPATLDAAKIGILGGSAVSAAAGPKAIDAHSAPATLVARPSARCHARGRSAARLQGPGALNVERSCEEADLRQIVRLSFLEGCLGETSAALEAAEALAHCSDPCVRAVLGRIARDERAHAELAWRFVAWALEREPSTVGVVRQLLDDIEREHAAPASAATPKCVDDTSPGDATFDTLRYGVVPVALRAELRRAAVHEITLPCGRALLASVAFGAAAPHATADV